ncbi:hypothetical protein [Streptomyces sp. NPDC056672]|uniref:hypothetical protein n=1 Tax=Streptomyces sp. NPDC056672 TaxID=3345906 RepID=UPI0036B3016B
MGTVNSGVLNNPLVYRLPDAPYTALATDSMDGAGAITTEEAARAIADAAELDVPPLRLPVGDMAAAILAARKAASDDVPFIPGVLSLRFGNGLPYHRNRRRGG